MPVTIAAAPAAAISGRCRASASLRRGPGTTALGAAASPRRRIAKPSKVTASGLTASEAALSRAEPRTAPADFEVESSPAPDPGKGVSVPGFEGFAKPAAELAPTPGTAARKLSGGQTLAARAARRAAAVGL